MGFDRAGREQCNPLGVATHIFLSVVSTRLFFSGGEARRVTDALFKEDIGISAKNLLIDMSCMKGRRTMGSDGEDYDIYERNAPKTVQTLHAPFLMIVALHIIKGVRMYRHKWHVR